MSIAPITGYEDNERKGPVSSSQLSNTHKQEIAADFLMSRRRYDHNQFLQELTRVGLRFVAARVDRPDDQRRFANSFNRLVHLGCLPATLASTLYSFCKMYVVWDAPRPYGEPVAFPSIREVKKIRSDLQNALQGIRQIERFEVFEVLAKRARCLELSNQRKPVLELLGCYAEALSSWCGLRKDIVRSAAPVISCCYVKMATGQLHFFEVAELLQCLGYAPDSKRQHRSKKKESTKEKKRSKNRREPEEEPIPDLCFDSLARNFANFSRAQPVFCERLTTELESDHAREIDRSAEEFDYWVGEKDIPVEVLNQLRPNRFDWNTVFPDLDYNPRR